MRLHRRVIQVSPEHRIIGRVSVIPSSTYHHELSSAILVLCFVRTTRSSRFLTAFLDETYVQRLQASLVQRFLRPKSRSEEDTSELQSLMRTSYAVFCLTKKK